MAVPEAALDLNDRAAPRQHDVGPTWKRPDVEAEAVNQRVERAARD